MRFDRFFVDNVEDDLLRIVTIIVVGNAGDPRSAALPTRWQAKFSGRTLCLAYTPRGQRAGLTEMALGDQARRQAAVVTGDITELYAHFDRNDYDGQTVLLDFTGMEQPAIFFALKALRDIGRIRRVFGAYTEPLGYKTREGVPFQEAFDLTEEFIDFQAIPGFVRKHDTERKRQLLVYMGFEGRRFIKILEEVDHDPNLVHAVFGIPAFQPGWQYLTLGTNQPALERSRAHLHRAEANNVFDAYEAAERVVAVYPRHQVILAPIGTKPHAVGAALYAARHEDALIVYDFPIKQTMFRTHGVGKTSIYNLTELVLG